MNPCMIKERLIDRNECALVDLNDWAVNTFREHCREMGYQDQKGVLRIEFARIREDNLTIEQYLRLRRTGSRYRLTRLARKAVWCVYETKRLLAGLEVK